MLWQIYFKMDYTRFSGNWNLSKDLLENEKPLIRSAHLRWLQHENVLVLECE